ncbi:MAG: hypothetical protein KKI08_23120 [Armatimonadetes bacterium]|nr:hypothetical protein [Armatimonadota bacterium]
MSNPAVRPAADPSLARGISWRVIIIAFIVAPLNAYFMAYLLGPRGVEDPTVVALFWNVVFLLFLFRLINAALQRWAPKLAFSPAELIAFFILMSVATTAGGLDTMKTTFSTMQGPAYFATEVNHWEQLFFRELPLSMTVNDMPALNRLWDGGHSILEQRNWQPWLGPVFRWWLLYTCMWAAPAGLAVLLRKRWVEQERMSFPIVQLPLEMSQPTFSGFRHPAFWIAATAVVCINLLNGLHQFYPSIPVAAIKINQSQTFNLQKFFPNRPWSAVGWWWMCFYPWVIGLGLLLPSELSLSLWVFHLFWKVEAVTTSWMGFTNIREFPYMKEQSFGGYLAILGFSLWAGRRTWEGVWRRILRGASKTPPAVGHTSHEGGVEDDYGEALSYRASALLFAAGLVAAIVIGVSIKMSWAVAIAFFVQYYIMTAIIGRIRAEMGLPTHELERLGPTVMQGNILGPRMLGVQNLTSLSLFFGFTRGMRNIPFPLQFEALYLARHTGSSQRRLLLATLAMIPVAVALSFFMTLALGYHHGLGMNWAKWMPWSCQEAWNQLTGWLNRNEPFQWNRIIASVVGFGVYFGLMVLRTRWIGWPLHPAGFALSTTWYMAHMWCPMMIAWITKTVTLRYAGGKAMRALRAAAFGLILADVVSGSLWILYGLFTNTTTYSFWP